MAKPKSRTVAEPSRTGTFESLSRYVSLLRAVSISGQWALDKLGGGFKTNGVKTRELKQSREGHHCRTFCGEWQVLLLVDNVGVIVDALGQPVGGSLVFSRNLLSWDKATFSIPFFSDICLHNHVLLVQALEVFCHSSLIDLFRKAGVETVADEHFLSNSTTRAELLESAMKNIIRPLLIDDFTSATTQIAFEAKTKQRSRNEKVIEEDLLEARIPTSRIEGLY
ncbi:hypothetical protein V6N11_047592 [Hibiscus sabdariffa]|uniref:Uncharacterized protein n=1 Tax=Hibiscus sabdariffa TaxID=183260 RepID=A0ABR2NKY0_9ROSI